MIALNCLDTVATTTFARDNQSPNVIISSMYRNGPYLALVFVTACLLQAGTVAHAVCPYDLAGAQQRVSRASTSLEEGIDKYNEALETYRINRSPPVCYFRRILTPGVGFIGFAGLICESTSREKKIVQYKRRRVKILNTKHDKSKEHLGNIERFAKTHRDCQSLLATPVQSSEGNILDKTREAEEPIPVAALRSGESISGAASVIDGDTIIVQGRRFELFGIDAPEIKQTCRKAGMTWPCGEEAADYLRNLLIDDLVTCDQRGRDRLGRIVSVCLIQNQDINASLVRQGWALANSDTSTDYVAAQENAKDAGAGIWSGEFIPPAAWRRGKR